MSEKETREEEIEGAEMVTDDVADEVEEPDRATDGEDEKPEPATEGDAGEDDEPDDARKGPMPQPPKKKKKSDSKAKAYADEVIKETKRVTWPDRDEVAKWSLIVLASIAFFTIFAFLVDNFIANPIIYGISGFASGAGFGRKAIALTVAFFVSGLGTAIGVMLHSGGEQGGLSDGLASNMTGGSAVAEKNLNRITIVLGILFAVSVALMMIWFPLGTIAGA